MNSPDVNRLFSCFADSSDKSGNTLRAFIFSLKNSEGLPPFKCLAEDKSKAIYKGSYHGPSFGDGPFLKIEGLSAEGSQAHIVKPYKAPMEVKNKQSVLAGTAGFFTPDNYEVFYLA